MTEQDMNVEEAATTRPRRSRQPKAERRIFVYRLIDGKPKEQGSFPEAVIGEPLERRLPTFLKEMFGTGDFKVEIRKPNGHFERSYDFSIAAEIEPEQERIIDIEPEEFDDEPDDLSFPENTGQMSAVEVENMLLKERLRRLEEDTANRKTGNQSETQSLIAALEESRREQREMMMMMLAQAQKPQQDATLQAMSMLEKSFGMISKARDLSEQIAPTGSNEGSGGGSFIADGAKLIDSLGRNAGTFLPIITGLIPKAPIPSPAGRPPVPQVQEAVSNGSTSDLSDLAAKIQKKEAEKK